MEFNWTHLWNLFRTYKFLHSLKTAKSNKIIYKLNENGTLVYFLFFKIWDP